MSTPKSETETPLPQIDESKRLENMFPRLGKKLRNAASSQWRGLIPVLCERLVGSVIDEQGVDFFPIFKEWKINTFARNPMVRKFASHFGVDVGDVAIEARLQLQTTIKNITDKLCKNLMLDPRKRAIKKLKGTTKLLKALARIKFKGDPVRSKILKNAARMVSIHANDIQHGS